MTNRMDKAKYIKTGLKSAIKPLKEELVIIAELAENMQKEFNVFGFVNKFKDVPAELMIKILKALKEKKPDNYWSYGTAVVKKEMPSYYESLMIKQHEGYKEAGLTSAANILKQIVGG